MLKNIYLACSILILLLTSTGLMHGSDAKGKTAANQPVIIAPGPIERATGFYKHLVAIVLDYRGHIIVGEGVFHRDQYAYYSPDNDRRLTDYYNAPRGYLTVYPNGSVETTRVAGTHGLLNAYLIRTCLFDRHLQPLSEAVFTRNPDAERTMAVLRREKEQAEVNTALREEFGPEIMQKDYAGALLPNDKLIVLSSRRFSDQGITSYALSKQDLEPQPPSSSWCPIS